MDTKVVSLERFHLKGVLGEGADLQVFAATDADTGIEVVVKRPHPAMIARGQHRDIERRMERAIALREELGGSLPHVSRVVGQTPVGPRNGWFGDTLDAAYTAIVEERARGLPLVGSAVDGIKGFAIGLPQSLFALHPLVAHAGRDGFPIQEVVLDVAEAFDGIGRLALDLRPQNVFFDPRSAAATVIDVGNVTVAREATRRQPALDLHDFYLEMFKWYATPFDPPGEARGYFEPRGMGSVQMFNHNLDRMIEEFSAITPEPLKSAAVAMLRKIRRRGYEGLREFRTEFEDYLSLARERCEELAQSPKLSEAWRAAKDELRAPYWRKFLFDAESDLVGYDY